MFVASLTTHMPKDTGVLVERCDSRHDRQVQSIRCYEYSQAILGINVIIQPRARYRLKLPWECEMPEVTYFFSVPYVLQMMAGGDEGMDCLKGKGLVGVRGAALPELSSRASPVNSAPS